MVYHRDAHQRGNGAVPMHHSSDVPSFLSGFEVIRAADPSSLLTGMEKLSVSPAQSSSVSQQQEHHRPSLSRSHARASLSLSTDYSTSAGMTPARRQPQQFPSHQGCSISQYSSACTTSSTASSYAESRSSSSASLQWNDDCAFGGQEPDAWGYFVDSADDRY